MEVNNNGNNVDRVAIMKARFEMMKERVDHTEQTQTNPPEAQQQNLDDNIQFNPGETPKVKEGEKGSIEYVAKLLTLDIELDKLGGYKPEYDEQGRIISLNLITETNDGVPVTLAGLNYQITYNDDGSTTISSQMNTGGELKVQKFDKDGNEIKDTVETPKVKEGEKGSLTAINKLIGKNLTTDNIYNVNYDENGRIIYMRSTEDTEDENKPYEYTIKYNDDGSLEIKTVNFNYRSNESTTIKTYDKNNNKITEVTLKPDSTELLSKIEYDEEGNIKSQLIPVESGELGSLDYFKNLLNLNGSVYLNYEKGLGSYDELGRLTSFNIGYNLASVYLINDTRVGSSKIDIKYNNDGGFEITTTDYRKNGTSETKVQKFDKNGNEIKDTAETPKVKEGEKGSLSYLKTLIGNIDESLHVQYYKYDDEGRITSMSNCDFSKGLVSNSDITYDISYADNGDVTVKCSGFVPYVRKMPASTTYHTDGSYDVTDQDGKVTKYDKDGNEITSSQTGGGSGSTPETGGRTGLSSLWSFRGLTFLQSLYKPVTTSFLNLFSSIFKNFFYRK